MKLLKARREDEERKEAGRSFHASTLRRKKVDN
jgi:hypothetical protein